MIFKPTFHAWLVWRTIDMLAGQHHLTIDEIEEGIALYVKTIQEKNLIVMAPEFTRSLVRAGTPVESKEDSCCLVE
jgi:hypothetical protein